MRAFFRALQVSQNLAGLEETIQQLYIKRDKAKKDFLGVARTWSIVRQANSYAITPRNPTLSNEISDSRKIHVRRKNQQMYKFHHVRNVYAIFLYLYPL